MNILDFAKKITHSSVEAKLKAKSAIDKCLKDKKNPDGSNMTPEHHFQLQSLSAWLGVSAIVGDELCKPETILEY